MQLASPYGGLAGLRGKMMSSNPYQPQPGMVEQLGRQDMGQPFQNMSLDAPTSRMIGVGQQMPGPDMSGHRADIKARYGLTDEETTAAIESRGQSLGGRPPVPGATSYDGTPLRPQQFAIGAPSPREPQQLGPMQIPGGPPGQQLAPPRPMSGPCFAKPLSPAPSEQGAGGGLAEQEWRLKIEPVEMNMGGRIPSYQNGGDIDPEKLLQALGDTTIVSQSPMNDYNMSKPNIIEAARRVIHDRPKSDRDDLLWQGVDQPFMRRLLQANPEINVTQEFKTRDGGGMFRELRAMFPKTVEGIGESNPPLLASVPDATIEELVARSEEGMHNETRRDVAGENIFGALLAMQNEPGFGRGVSMSEVRDLLQHSGMLQEDMIPVTDSILDEIQRGEGTVRLTPRVQAIRDLYNPPGRASGGIIGLAHGGMVPGYAHGGEVPGYFLGGLLKGIKSLGKKGLQYAPQIMGLVGEEIPGFNKLSSIGRAAIGALAKQGSRKASGQDFSFQDMLGDAGRTYAMESAKDRIRESLYGDAIPEGVSPAELEQMMKEGEGEGWKRSVASGERYQPTFVDPDITGFGPEKGSGSMWKDIFTDSDAARTALEAALDIPVGEALALGFTEQEKKRGQRGEPTGHLGGFDPMSTVGRVMPPSMSGVPGRSATPATDIASQLTYGNMPVDYTGRAEGGIIPEYQYGGMYGEEGDEFDPQGFYVPQSPYPPPRSQMLPDPGMLGEGEGEQGGFLNADPGEYGTSLGPTLENTYNMDPYGALPPEVLSGERDLTKKEIDERAENAKTEIDRQRTQLRNQSKKSEEGEPDDAFVAPDDPMAQRAIDDAKTPSGKYDEDGNLRIDTEYTDARTGQYTPATYTDPRPGRVMPPTGAQNTGSAMSYGPSNQFSGVGSGFYGENKWFDPNAEEVAAKEISGLDPHQLPRTAEDFAGTGDQAGADLLSRLGKADGGMIGSANPMLQHVSPEDMQALMMASVQLDSPNSRDVISDIMRKYNLSATDLNQMLETLMAQAQTMQAGGKVDDVPGYGIGGALKKALKVASFGGAQLLPEDIRDPMNKAILDAAPVVANTIPGVGQVASAALRPVSQAVSGKIDADRARDSLADQMTYGDLGMQAGGLINGGGGDAMSDDIYVNAEMEANGQTQPIAVSSGEYIVPGDVVSHLGSGNTEGGADVMDQFVEDVRVQRTGTPVQPDPIDLSDVLPGTYGDRYA